MSGGAQMDLRRECDWSDPYVLGGGAARLAERTFRDRTRPNCLGVHFYDEPTLTHLKHPVTGEDVPFNIAAQDRSYRAAFGRDPIQYNELKKDEPASVGDWLQMNRWRLSLLDAAWKLCQWPVNYIEPGYLTANQGSWLFSGYGVGYYFNYQRSLPIYSGHGGYDYLYSGHYAPGFFFEFGRARDYHKPQWYLPLWYDRHGDLFRAQQYMSFVTNLQGIALPPDILMHKPSAMHCAGAVVESNKAMLRLGTIFTTMPPTKPGVAVLFSLSHNLDAMTRDTKDTYYGDYQWTRLLHVYLATKMIQVPIFAVVEEDLLDGTFDRDHRVLILAGTKKLDPAVIRRLEAFIEAGGTVLASDDTAVDIKGMVRFPMDPEFLEGHKNWDKWAKEGKWDLWNTSVVTHAAYAAARSLAPVLKAKLKEAAAKKPGTSFAVFECDQDGIVAGHEGKGDIDYYFAVNASPDFETFGWYYLRGVEAKLKIPATDSRQALYDAVLGGEAALERSGSRFTGTLRFGPGQMRAFARTARAIGGVQVTVSPVTADFTRCTVPETAPPQEVEIVAVLVDDQGQILNGSAPLRVQVFDALKAKRQDLYRATDCGIFRMKLPMAANDSGWPAGEWTVVVRELLSSREGRATLRFTPPRQCGAVAGQVQRALYFGRDLDNVFRFFRVHKDVAIVTGSSEFNSGEAQRLASILKPWDVRCSVVSALDAAKPRELADEQKPTWVGWAAGAGRTSPLRSQPS